MKEYNFISIINLLGEKKSNERKLTQYLSDLLNNLPEEIHSKIYYDHIDFHELVKETDFSNINKLVIKIVDKNDFTVLMHNLIDDTYDVV